MFGYRHYVPILRSKRGELVALKKLRDRDRTRMTPLLELTPEASRTQLKTAKDIRDHWGVAKFFADFTVANPNFRVNGSHPLVALGAEARALRLSFIPVTGLDRGTPYQSAVANVATTDRRGACIRLYKDDLTRPTLANDLRLLLTRLKLRPEAVDILVDFKITDGSSMSYVDLCSCLPNLLKWRTFTVASGAFPEDLTDFEKNRQHVLNRQDWTTWRSQVTAKPTLLRPPSYSDYTVQHPIVIPLKTENPNISASIRYTAEDYWVIMRGEGLKNDGGPGYAQYAANSLQLSERDEFCGAGFSYGDRYIEEISQGIGGIGSPETFIRAGVNHHLTLVVNQIANLPGSLVGDAPVNGPTPNQQLQRAERKPSRVAYSASRLPRQARLIE